MNSSSFLPVQPTFNIVKLYIKLTINVNQHLIIKGETENKTMATQREPGEDVRIVVKPQIDSVDRVLADQAKYKGLQFCGGM